MLANDTSISGIYNQMLKWMPNILLETAWFMQVRTHRPTGIGPVTPARERASEWGASEVVFFGFLFLKWGSEAAA